MNPVFVTGGTGYLGRPLVEVLIAKGYRVHALVRAGSEARLPPGATPVVGNALEAAPARGVRTVEVTEIRGAV